MYRFLLALGLCAGCTSLVPSTVSQLAELSPATTDPAHIAIAFDLPASVDIPPGGATMFLGAERTDTGEKTGRRFPVARRTDPEGRPVFRLSPSEQEAFRAQQSEIQRMKAVAPDALHGTFSVALAPCKTGVPLDPRAPVSIAIQLAPEAAFLPLVKGVPLRRLDAAGAIEEWPECASNMAQTAE